MKQTISNGKFITVLAAAIAGILVLIPFHAILTVWLASALGHYTALRLWKEFLTILLAGGVAWLLIKDAKLRRQLIESKLVWLIGAYTLVQIVWGVVSWRLHDVSAKALGYGWIVDVRFLLFFLVVWLVASRASSLHERWQRLVLWPALIVGVIGLLQYFVLPYDFLKHLGYSASTIYPYETINNNIHHIRIMSTLRGANPLGAYMVVILSLLASLWFKKRRNFYLAVGIIGAGALLLSFSRSAWIGAAAAVSIVLWVRLNSQRARKVILILATLGLVLALGTFVVLRNNTTFQDTIFHTSNKSTIKTTSDQGHASALSSGLHDVLHEPLGRGPGTAGPASVDNNHPARIAENYFIQIGQEVGWLGLGLFLAINFVVAKLLWLRRSDPLALGLLAALVGVSLVNLLSHAWADDTLAYLWWGLAGIALAHATSAPDTKS